MASLSRRNRRETNIWPGFVDALATLLMVLIFVLLIFVVSQFFLNNALSGRDEALGRLQSQVSELADLLALEREANKELRIDVSQLSAQLQSAVSRREDLTSQITQLTRDNKAAEKELTDKLDEVNSLTADLNALEALKEELEARIAKMAGKLDETEGSLLKEKELSESARAQVALLNKQLNELRKQMAALNATLEASEELARKQKVQIANLGSRLNAALAGKVQELARYRSEFFGKLREILGKTKGVKIVGDRFVFQSEVLFETGSADLGEEGKKQLSVLAETLKTISNKIPPKVNWILRVDGHTDKVPIKNLKFPSNWELSSARAISVVRQLVESGIPSERLAATGFGQFQPLDTGETPDALAKNRRIELKLTQR